MVTFDPRFFAALVLCPLILYALSQRFDPQRLHGRLLTQCTRGICLVCAWNLLFSPVLGLNPLSAWIAGVLGLPGLGLLALCVLMV